MNTKDIKTKIREYFFLNPTIRLRVRQIEKEVKVPLPSAIRYAKELEQEGILKSSLISGVKFYAADRLSEIFLFNKKIFNLKKLFECGLIKDLTQEYNNPVIIIFGSYAKGEDIETSDIDLYLQTSQTIGDWSKFEKKLQRKIQIFKYQKITHIKNKELANNILNGIILNGFIEVFR